MLSKFSIKTCLVYSKLKIRSVNFASISTIEVHYLSGLPSINTSILFKILQIDLLFEGTNSVAFLIVNIETAIMLQPQKIATNKLKKIVQFL